MNFEKTATVVTAIGIATLLSACEPTDADINKAFQAEIEQSNKEAAQDAGGKLPADQQAKLISSKKIACKEAQGQAGYVCDVEGMFHNCV